MNLWPSEKFAFSRSISSLQRRFSQGVSAESGAKLGASFLAYFRKNVHHAVDVAWQVEVVFGSAISASCTIRT
jgi:hypothetical protein